MTGYDERRLTEETGAPAAEIERRLAAARARVAAALDQVPAAGLAGEDRRAFDLVRAALDGDLAPRQAAAEEPAAPAPSSDCAEPAATFLAAHDEAALRARTYRCYGDAARSIAFAGETLDRLTVLARMAAEPDPARRRALFDALRPLFRSVDGDGGESSPFHLLALATARRWASEGSPVDARARALGVEPAAFESWLDRFLSAWRGLLPERTEPWDYAFLAGAAERELAPALPRERLAVLARDFYRGAGADLDRLRVHFDLEPRPGKTPVAFTDFGARRRVEAGAPRPTEPWIFATYRVGGFDNLVELLHESGHAIHIAAIDTRPAFLDWPDNDAFTEALADVPALEAYEPDWQRRTLGRAVALGESIRAKYAGIALDALWALFEIRLYRDATRDPDVLWSDLAEKYLGIARHPEVAWWARRGQLIDAPGYMANYALGAFVAADVRARIAARRGAGWSADPSWYPWFAGEVYRYGLERTSRRVLEDFLGRPLAPDAVLADLARAR
jgi:hypothetical protein